MLYELEERENFSEKKCSKVGKMTKSLNPLFSSVELVVCTQIPKAPFVPTSYWGLHLLRCCPPLRGRLFSHNLLPKG